MDKKLNREKILQVDKVSEGRLRDSRNNKILDFYKEFHEF